MEPKIAKFKTPTRIKCLEVLNAQQVNRVVQGCQIRQLVDLFPNFFVDSDRLVESDSPVNYSVADSDKLMSFGNLAN
jgi:hypothetical protein